MVCAIVSAEIDAALCPSGSLVVAAHILFIHAITHLQTPSYRCSGRVRLLCMMPYSWLTQHRMQHNRYTVLVKHSVHILMHPFHPHPHTSHQAVAQGHWTQDDSIMAWHNGIVRIAANDKQRHSLASAALADPDRLTALTIDQLQKRMLQRDQVHASTSTADISENGEHVEERAESSADALLLRNAVVLHPQRYMRYAVNNGVEKHAP